MALCAIAFAFVCISGLLIYNQAVCSDYKNVYEICRSAVKQLISLKGLYSVFICAAVFFVIPKYKDQVTTFVFTYRYILAGILFVICVVLELSGSSIGCWNMVTNTENQGLLSGIPRTVRSDEWAVSTPMALSQYKDAAGSFSYFSHVIRGTTTDVFLEYGQPVRNIAVIFRPFHWGYLFLPAGMGLAFYWCGRYIALAMVSFEMGRFLTRDNRSLSFVYAILLVLAPTVQWWFAINGLVEMMIYAQLSILLLLAWIRENHSMMKRAIYISGICLCAGGFILTLYPAWQIPMAYCIAGLGVYVLIVYGKEAHIRKGDVMLSAICISFFAAVLGYIFYTSRDTIASIVNTAYPGKRFETGGGAVRTLVNYVSEVWYAIRGTGTEVNVCESTTFIDFFPFCYILPVVVVVMQKKKDMLLGILGILGVVLNIWIIVGFPSFLAKITLMSHSTAVRTAQIVGCINIMLLIRALSLLEIKKRTALHFGIASITGGIFVCGANYLSHKEYYTKVLFGVTLFIFIIAIYALLQLRICRRRSLNVLYLSGVMLMAGLLVNPLQKGVENLYDMPLYRLLSSVQEKDASAVWVSESGYPISDFTGIAGVRCVNSTNVYPVLSRWYVVDPGHTAENIYNRYAHIEVTVKPSGNAEFQLISPDQFAVALSVENLQQMNVTYILTTRNLEDELGNSDDVHLEAEDSGYKVYKISER